MLHHHFTSNTFGNKFKYLGLAFCFILLSACSSSPSLSKLGTKKPKTNTKTTTQNLNGVPQKYQVRSGDTVSKIANRFGLNWREISALNNLDSNHTVHVGQWLTLWKGNTGGVNLNNSYNNTTPQPTTTPTTTRTTQNNGNVGSAQNVKFGYPVHPDTKVARNFGDPSSSSGPEGTSPGMWFWGNEGEPVYASQNGTVVQIEPTQNSGTNIVIAHDNGFMTTYLHTGKPLVNKGQMVKKGEKIASLRKHTDNISVVEFRVARYGTFIDPLSVLSR